MTDPAEQLTPDDRQTPKLIVGHVECSPTIGKIAKALAKAQAGFPTVAKDQTATIPMKGGGSYSYNYANLASTIDACRESLVANEIALVQPTTSAQGRVTVQTMLVHSSGEWMSSDLSMPVAENRAQAVGTAISYARRYALQAFVGLAADDDDGAEADSNPPPPDPLPALRKRFGELLRERKVEVESAGHKWEDGVWQKVAAIVTDLDAWPEQPCADDYESAIDGLETMTIDEIGLWPAPYDPGDGGDLETGDAHTPPIPDGESDPTVGDR